MTIHLGNSAAQGPFVVALQDQQFVHSGSTSMRTAGNVFQSDGIRRWRRTFTFVQLNPLTDWIIPNVAASSSFEIRLTNLNWIVKDEGFGISPSGGVWIDSVTTPTGGDPDGDEDVWFDLGTTREWTFVDNDNDASIGTQHAQFDFQIRIGSTILATAAMDWFVNSGGGGGGGGGGGCFVRGEKFRMADGSLKEIQDIVPGDVTEVGGLVYQAIVGDGRVEHWYDVDGMVVTGHHVIYKDGEWVRVMNAGYNEVRGADTYYIVANEHHKLMAENGQLFSDFQEVDYMTTGWDAWVVEKMNGNTDDDAIREAIASTGVDSKDIENYFYRRGEPESYVDNKNRLLRELSELEKEEEEKPLIHPKTGRPVAK